MGSLTPITGQQVSEERVYSSKEVKEFLETYGDQEPSPQLYLSFFCIMMMWDDTTAKLHGIDRKYLERWFRYEHLITNPRLFWYFCYQMWHNGGSPDERWLDGFCRYNRLDIHFRERLKYFGGADSDDHHAYAQDYFNRRGSKVDITVYRGFKVRKGKAVRKGAKKVDNENAYFLDEGRGFSFSLSKTFSTCFIAPHWNHFFYKKYAGVTDPYEVRMLRTQIIAGKEYDAEDYVPEDWLGIESYCALGTFKIKKKDIIAVIMDMGEEEVICDPNNAKLIKYDFLTFADGMASLMLKQIKESIRDAYKIPLYFHKQDENKLLKKAKEYTSAMYDDPDLIKRILLRTPTEEDSETWRDFGRRSFDCDPRHGKMFVR